MGKIGKALDIFDIAQSTWFWKLLAFFACGLWFYTIYSVVRMIFNPAYRGECKEKVLAPFLLSLIILTIISFLDGSDALYSVYAMLKATMGLVFVTSMVFSFFYGLYAFVRIIFSSGNRMHWVRRVGFSIIIIIGGFILIAITDMIIRM